MSYDRTSEAEQSRPQTDTPHKPNYATLSANVEVWKANWIEYAKGEYGDLRICVEDFLADPRRRFKDELDAFRVAHDHEP